MTRSCSLVWSSWLDLQRSIMLNSHALRAHVPLRAWNLQPFHLRTFQIVEFAISIVDSNLNALRDYQFVVHLLFCNKSISIDLNVDVEFLVEISLISWKMWINSSLYKHRKSNNEPLETFKILSPTISVYGSLYVNKAYFDANNVSKSTRGIYINYMRDSFEPEDIRKIISCHYRFYLHGTTIDVSICISILYWIIICIALLKLIRSSISNKISLPSLTNLKNSNFLPSARLHQ